MNFENEMQSYFKLRNFDDRRAKIQDVIFRLKMQKMAAPATSLDMVEAITEYCLLIENNEERLLQYNRALESIHNVRRVLKEKKQVRQLLRSYHLECFIKYHTMKYEDEEKSIQNIFDLGGKIIEMINQIQKQPNTEYNDYYSLGCVWRAYGHISLLINKSKESSVAQRHKRIEKARELAHKAVELCQDTNNRDSHILSAYIFAFVEQLPQRTLHGDKASTEEDFIEYMLPYEILLEVARAYGSIEFEYLAMLNHIWLKLQRIIYAAGVSERKSNIIDEILDNCKKLEEYENIIHLPHLHFYRYVIQTDVYTSIVYFEAVKEEKFNYYIDEALKSAEKIREIYISSKMTGLREKVQMHHLLNTVYMIKSSFANSRQEKIEYLKKSEELLLENEKISAAWSPQVYSTWRDLSSIYFELSKIERNRVYFEEGVSYAKKAYNSALETDEFKDALFEAYKVAIIAEDYQDYILSKSYYEFAIHLIDKIIQSGKDYPYYHNLKTYLQARLLGVKAKEAHTNGNYAQAMNFYRQTSSLLQLNDFYSYEGLLYNAYALFEEASMRFIEERYGETLKILSSITKIFDTTVKRQVEDYETQFQSFIDRRAYDLQLLFFESSKTFCIAQSYILQSLIFRNAGDSGEAIKHLKEANGLLIQFKDRDIHIAGYYSFANGLFGLEQSELAIRESEYKSAASYLASASDQFETASQILASDEGLRKLCEGLKSFCQGWMYALEIMRRSTDLNSSELKKNYDLAHQSLIKATRDLEMFRKTYSSVHGFERLLSYFYYSILFQKTDDPTEKSEFKDKMTLGLGEALQSFKDAEDMERYGFIRDLLATLPQLEDVSENIFKPIDIPFTPYTPVFDTSSKVEPSGLEFTVSLDKTQAEVNDKIHYTIKITSDATVHIKQIDGIFPKNRIKVVSGMRWAKNGTVKIDRLLSPGQSISIEFTIRASMPLYSRKHPRLVYFTTKNEKYRAFATPLTLQIFPQNLLKTGVVNKVNEQIDLVRKIVEEIGINIGEFPIVYHNLNSYRETLSEYFALNKNTKHPKKLHASKLTIQQIAFVDPLGDVNILYDIKRHLYPRSIASLLNIIIHEKFGHGFFYQRTTLGKKLLELEYHRKGIVLLTKELEKISNKYAIGVQWLCISTLIANEGFAVWLVLKTLRKLLETSEKDQSFSQQIHQNIESIKTMFSNKNLNMKHEYFALKHETPIINPYALGYNLFLQIEEKYGELCIPKALEIAADIHLTRRQISHMPKIVKNDKNCADKRLEKIAQTHLEIERNNVTMFEKVIRRFLNDLRPVELMP
ncbi:MAG: hypothetical protein ACFFCD_01260 [Promethearchaeota archaeon]